jgi:hypothetical protein
MKSCDASKRCGTSSSSSDANKSRDASSTTETPVTKLRDASKSSDASKSGDASNCIEAGNSLGTQAKAMMKETAVSQELVEIPGNILKMAKTCSAYTQYKLNLIALALGIRETWLSLTLRSQN